jgi:hypothetical protein
MTSPECYAVSDNNAGGVMIKRIQLAVVALAFVPGFALAASPLRLECSAEQNLPGRALVCEYAMLGSLNDRLADLDEEIVRAGKAARVEPKRWLAARDACQDVECLDRTLEAGVRDARSALVDVESRQPTLILATARGVPVQIVQGTAPVLRAPPAPQREPQPRASAPTWSVREPSRLEPVFSVLTMLFLAAVAVYATVVRRIG